MDQRKYFYVTTPIYYVNDKPHIGHAYTTILADVLARYHRSKGIPTFFLTGVDEHGQKVQQAAQAAGIDPQTHCDRMMQHFKNAWQKLEIKYDFFMRTTDDFHVKTVQAVLQDLWDKGEIYESEYGGYYCVGCERFYTTKELVDGKCPQHLKEPDYIKEKNYFFRMSRYQDWLIEYIQKNPDFVQPETRKNEVLGFLKSPLEDLCISRPKTRLSWGIELPFNQDYVTYVWFDALLNYVTGIGYKRDETQFKKWWPATYHLIGKDIVTTHCVYWPTMMKAAGIPMPETIFAHGWWLVADTKMSKSLQNVVKPLDLIDIYGVDPVRYFLMRDMVLGQDANFSEEYFIKRYNSDLANDFGNLASRIATLIRKNFNGVVPRIQQIRDEENTIISTARKLPNNIDTLVENLRLNDAIEEIVSFIRSINKYMEVRQPWKLVKNDQAAAGTVLYTAAEAMRISAILLHPVMPGKIDDLLVALPTITSNRMELVWGQLKPGEALGDIPILFPRIDKSPSTKSKTQLAKPQEAQINIDNFAKVKLMTARVLAAEKVPKSEKLLKLKIHDGSQERQLVAGIAQHYQPEMLIGMTIVIVANLQPTKIFGIESQGMLLAAKKGDKLTLLTTQDELDSGASIS
jgi:methionyl-tRNA synthetase